MSLLFTSSDILQFAVRMEENGGAFYRKAAELTDKSEAKKLFEFMASEEAEHKKTFEKFLSQVTMSNEPPENYPGEYLAYLRNHIDGKVFFTGDVAKLQSIDTASALDFAIQREMDSILYYTELKAFISSGDRKTVDAIIDEERKHFAQLSEMKKKI